MEGSIGPSGSVAPQSASGTPPAGTPPRRTRRSAELALRTGADRSELAAETPGPSNATPRATAGRTGGTDARPVHAIDVARAPYPSVEQTLKLYSESVNDPLRSKLSNVWGLGWTKNIANYRGFGWMRRTSVTTAQTNTIVGSLGPAISRAAAQNVGVAAVLLGSGNTVAAALATQLAPNAGEEAAARLRDATDVRSEPHELDATLPAMHARESLNAYQTGLGTAVMHYGEGRAQNVVETMHEPGSSPEEFNAAIRARAAGVSGSPSVAVSLGRNASRRERMSVKHLAQHVKAGWSTQRLSPSERSMREAIVGLARYVPPLTDAPSADALGESAQILDAHAHDVARGPEAKLYDAVISAAPELKKALPYKP